jgi:hypothetical protein
MTQFEAQVIGDLKLLKNQVEQILGGSQPGRMSNLEDRVMHHEQSLQRMKGRVGAFGGALTVFHLAVDYFMGRR